MTNFAIRECVSPARWLLIREFIALVENLILILLLNADRNPNVEKCAINLENAVINAI